MQSRVARKQKFHFKAAEVPRLRDPQDRGSDSAVRCASRRFNYHTLPNRLLFKYSHHRNRHDTSTNLHPVNGMPNLRLITHNLRTHNSHNFPHVFPRQTTSPTLLISFLRSTRNRNRRGPRTNQTPSITSPPQYLLVLPSRSPLNKRRLTRAFSLHGQKVSLQRMLSIRM